MRRRPDILLILADDMGYSDIGCYGGEVATPNLDRLAAEGVRMTRFFNTARCCPSRASLLTGLYPHQADVGHMVGDDQVDGYLGDLSFRAATIAEILREQGYGTAMSGKWHVTGHVEAPGNWPLQRGFDRFFGMLNGAGSYYDPCRLRRGDAEARLAPGDYFTDAIGREAAAMVRDHHASRPADPLFLYAAFTAPHWPLHALPEDIARYRGRFAAGWDRLREERLARLVSLGILPPGTPLSERDPVDKPWDTEPDKEWQQRRMEAYAAQVDRMDQAIGTILRSLEETGRLDDTLVLFLSDNGGCAEGIGPRGEDYAHPGRQSARLATQDGRPVRFGNDPSIVPGPEDTFASYGRSWGNLSNTPFRLFKSWVHEGGIATPLVVRGPRGLLPAGAIRHQPAQLPDILATIEDLVGIPHPSRVAGRDVLPCEGHSLLPTLREDAPHGREVLYWEHEGNAAVRRGRWKLVRRHPGPWELYDVEADRCELHDLAAAHPDIVADLASRWSAWARRVNVRDWDELQALRKARRAGRN